MPLNKEQLRRLKQAEDKLCAQVEHNIKVLEQEKQELRKKLLFVAEGDDVSRDILMTALERIDKTIEQIRSANDIIG